MKFKVLVLFTNQHFRCKADDKLNYGAFSFTGVLPYLVLNLVFIQELIELGARTLIVPGNIPIGCWPINLTVYGSQLAKE